MKRLLINLLLALPVMAMAQATIHVRTAAQGDEDGTSWANATTLSQALKVSQSGDQIWVWSGVYTATTVIPGSGCNAQPFFLGDGVSLYGGFNATTETVSTRSFANGLSIISGDVNLNGTLDENERTTLLSFLPVSTATITVDGFAFKQAGSAIDAAGANFVVNNCDFNLLHSDFGVVRDNGATGTYSHCNFLNSELFENGAVVNSKASTIEFINTWFDGNIKHGDKVFGGSILKGDGTTTTFVNCAFQDNEVMGETDPFETTSGNTLSMINCTFSNKDLGSTSAAVRVFDQVTIVNSILSLDNTLEHLSNLSDPVGFAMSYTVVPSGYSGLGSNGQQVNSFNPGIDLMTLQPLGPTSGVIDVGDQSSHPSPSGFDLAGSERLTGHNTCEIDLGAFELTGDPCSAAKHSEEHEALFEPVSVSIYPNPSNGEVVIQWQEQRSGSLEVLDMMGRVIESEQFNEALRFQLDLTSVHNGLYQIVLRSGDDVNVLRVVIQH